MSLFDDDFYSTRVSRRTRQDDRLGGRRTAGWRIFSTWQVAVVSSLGSAAAVAVLFSLLSGGSAPKHEAKPALANAPALVETSERIISASEKVRPSVVSIINLAEQTKGHQADNGSGDNSGDSLENASLGSGVIYEKKNGKAYIITNAHVVSGAAEVQAVLMSGDKRKAEIVGEDAISDLAVLTIDSKGIDTVAEIGDSDKLRVGEMVIAVGNPLGFGDSVSQGIVSFLHRIVPVSLNQDGVYDWEQEVVQTTAPINQGNSGGVLADLNGRVIGINSMKVADTGVEGIGFAIPIDTVMPVVKQLIEHGKVLRPYMGVYTMDLSNFLDNPSGTDGSDPSDDVPKLTLPADVTDGALVLEAVGPADEAGLQTNDVITELDGNPIRGTMDLRKYLYNRKAIGESLTVTYYRDGEKQKLELTLTEKDDKQ
ncbi:PDZ domain-containing protein [Cohnella pontilimi]|uniref:PDZ domain-containing protein n=1 Tax=Cohnella pontilimi TaxID=2564100 RepID=A0A4U0FAG7_9BACL|nr:trypsin-like peptidase domain-containing protein [Cohnella pontilimi]TJY41735.1 PDZ domain-containing protein [Cohnella pontilimi]